MGGEKKDKLPHFDCIRGLPPHGRGKVYLGPQLLPGHGITPAWAGKSRSTTRRTWAPRDHPRMGGEKVQGMVISGSMMGSPPHGRGKVRHLSHGLLPCG